MRKKYKHFFNSLRESILFFILLFAFSQTAFCQSTTFSYTGTVQTYTIPPGVDSIYVDVVGATGGMSSLTDSSTGGKGGRIQCTLLVSPGQVLHIYIGGVGVMGTLTSVGIGGFNGGGNGGADNSLGDYTPSGGGGGSTDIRFSPYSLTNRVVVASGGGGGGYGCIPKTAPGGDGGGLIGSGGYSCVGCFGCVSLSPNGGQGGSSISGGIPGVGTGIYVGTGGILQLGGNGSLFGGGGGGGLYGGGGGFGAGGGGGSSFADSTNTINVVDSSGYNALGNGWVIITPKCSGPVITGFSSICVGSADTLSVTPTDGIWSPSNSNATIVGGLITGIYPGIDTINYIITNSCGTYAANIVITINPLPATPSVITGIATTCQGTTTILGDVTTGGIWSSNNANIATVGSTGLVAGISTGIDTISYTVSNTWCASNVIKTVSILGSTSSDFIYTIAGTGIAGYGGDGGPATAAQFSYPTGVVVDRTGNYYVVDHSNNVIRKVSTSGIISTIAGNGIVGFSGDGGQATAAELNGPVGIAIDSSGNLYVADTYNERVRKISTSGIISTVIGNGVAGYSGDGGPATLAKIYEPSWGIAIDGGGNIYLSDGYYGVIRKVSTLGIVSTIAGNGIVGFSGDGGQATNAELWYPCGIAVDQTGNIFIADNNNSRIRKVNSMGIITTISGNGTYGFSGDGSQATNAQLYDPRSIALDTNGNIYFTDEGNYRIRKISASGIISTFAGNGILGYTGDGGPATAAKLYGGIGGCGIAVDINDNLYFAEQWDGIIRKVELPKIGGIPSVCVGNLTSLSYPISGGSWSSSNILVATIGSTGIVAGISSGIVTITYSIIHPCNTEATTLTITVNPLPSAGSITGPSTVCPASTITLSDASPSGIWSCTNATASIIGGIITGVSPGLDTIKYTVTNTCGTSAAIKVITINPLPYAGVISGASTICTDVTSAYTDGTPGGLWSSTDGNASVSGLGMATGISAGTDSIEYIAINSCGTAIASKAVTINPSPTAGIITGLTSVCTGSSITLTDMAFGGTWSSSATSTAIVGSTGIVSGVSTGTITINYSVTNTCGSIVASHYITVNPSPNAGSITGVSSVCIGSNITLADASSGGLWSATNSNSFVSSGGIAEGITAGIDTIKYTITNSCGSASASKIITVNPLPNAGTIVGLDVICPTMAITLTDMSVGGIWSAANGNATVLAGVVTGVTAGMDTIIYTFANSCGTAITSHPITINALPEAGSISGSSDVCQENYITLTDSVAGGVWDASDSIVVVSSTGLVYGVTSGIDTIIYTITNSCGSVNAKKVIAVNPLPNSSIISGPSELCVNDTVTLTDSSTGGFWSSSNTSLAGIGTTGFVTGISAGDVIITYSVSNICGTATALTYITINPLPTADTIIGANTVCPGQVIYLNDSALGGIWTSSNNSLATVDTSGVVSGISSGAVIISYTVTNGCGSASALIDVTVDSETICNDLVPGITASVGIQVYPNPNKGEFIITGSFGNASDDVVAIELTDLLGQTVYKNQLQKENGNLNGLIQLSSTIANGMYMLLIKSGIEHKVFHIVIDQ